MLSVESAGEKKEEGENVVVEEGESGSEVENMSDLEHEDCS